jgi:hypothetical protein
MRAASLADAQIDVVDPSVRDQHKVNHRRPPGGYRCRRDPAVNESGGWKTLLPGQAAFCCPHEAKTPDQCVRVDTLRCCG